MLKIPWFISTKYLEFSCIISLKLLSYLVFKRPTEHEMRLKSLMKCFILFILGVPRSSNIHSLNRSQPTDLITLNSFLWKIHYNLYSFWNFSFTSSKQHFILHLLNNQFSPYTWRILSWLKYDSFKLQIYKCKYYSLKLKIFKIWPSTLTPYFTCF